MKHIPRRQRRKHVVTDNTSIEVLKQLVRKHPRSIKKVTFVGQAIWLRSGTIRAVRDVKPDQVAPWQDLQVEAEDSASFEPYLTNKMGIRFHCGSGVGWIINVIDGVAAIQWWGDHPLRPGDRFYLERLPRVYGSLDDFPRGRHVELQHLLIDRNTAWDRLKDDESV